MRKRIAFAAAALLIAEPAAAQEMPSSLQLVGTVKPTNAAQGAIRGAQVLVVDRASGSTIGSGPVVDGQGTFLVELMQPSRFNGRVMTLQIVHVGRSYDLREEGGPAEFPYAGSFPFPTRMNKTVTVTLETGDAIGTANGVERRLDLNGDGVFDQKDIDLLRAALTSGTGDTSRFDVNGDGVFNSLDVIEAQRALIRQQSR